MSVQRGWKAIQSILYYAFRAFLAGQWDFFALTPDETARAVRGDGASVSPRRGGGEGGSGAEGNEGHRGLYYRSLCQFPGGIEGRRRQERDLRRRAIGALIRREFDILTDGEERIEELGSSREWRGSQCLPWFKVRVPPRATVVEPSPFRLSLILIEAL